MTIIKYRLFILLTSALVLGNITALSGNISLNGKWQLSYWKQPSKPVVTPQAINDMQVEKIDASVPGNVELDLMAAGLIPDPMIGSNVNTLRKYENYQWCYTKTFEAPLVQEGQRVELFFGGIDCLADIWLNGEKVGEAANMLIEHKYDVTEFLKRGENTLQVIIRSAVMEAQKHTLGTISIGNFPAEEAVYIRKAPHMYGWDIMPRLVSAGLWRDVELRVLNPTRLKDVNWMTINIDTTAHTARIFTDVQMVIPFDKFDKVKAQFTLRRKGKIVYQNSQIVSTPAFRHIFELKNVDFWWPRGYGEAALYDASVQLIDSDGKELDVNNCKVGVRTVKLDMDDINLPGKPGQFRFIINNEPIFIHGTNWVPMDALHSRDKSHLNTMIDMAVDINCNMIRCWGGNVYEDTDFFDLCDQNGILVWQDFGMGCTFYPQRDDFARMIEEEVTSVVLKFRNHASLILWSGNNENDLAMRWTLQPLNINPNKDVITREVIARVLYEFDPTRPYIPSSPYYSQAVWEHGGGDELLPENHLWGPRGYYKEPYYTKAACCFVSEIGYHGCPNVESLNKMMTKEGVYPWTKDKEWNDEWVTKSTRRFPSQGKTFDRNNLMLNQVNLLFGEIPTKLDDFVFASQAVQAEAMKFFVELWRGQKFSTKTGIVWWNLRDGWPIISDAIVDYYNSKKMAYYFIKNAQTDLCVLINDPVDNGYPLIVANDTRNLQKGQVIVSDMASNKEIYKGNFEVSANGMNKIASLPLQKGQGILLIKYKVGQKEYSNHYLYGEAPFNLQEYKKLLKKTGLYPSIK